jgi:hypothetical protein
MQNSEVGMPFCLESQNHDRFLKNGQVLLDESFRKMVFPSFDDSEIVMSWVCSLVQVWVYYIIPMKLTAEKLFS